MPFFPSFFLFVGPYFLGKRPQAPAKEQQRAAQQQIMAQGKTEQLLLIIRKAIAQHRQGKLEHAREKNKQGQGAQRALAGGGAFPMNRRWGK